MECNRGSRLTACILALQLAFALASPSHGYRAVIPAVPEKPILQDDLHEYVRIPRRIVKNADIAPDFTQADIHGNLFHLKGQLQKGPVVLIFYRGQWCDSCLEQLRQIQRKLTTIDRLGATVIAVAPQNIQLALSTEVTNGIGFPLIVDKHNQIARTYGLTYRLEDLTRALYALSNVKLDQINNDSGEELPLPATYVIGTDGRVVYFYQNYDYRMRAPVTEVLRAVKKCQRH